MKGRSSEKKYRELINSKGQVATRQREVDKKYNQRVKRKGN